MFPGFAFEPADRFDRVVNLPHRSGQFLDAAFTADVHEINLRLIEEEMVVQRGHAQPVVERG